MNQVTSNHPSFDHLVGMTAALFGTVPTPPGSVAFGERIVRPTLEASDEHLVAGRILAGSPTPAATSAPDHEDMIGGDPLWPDVQTRVVPRGTGERRAANMRRDLEWVRAQLRPCSNASFTTQLASAARR